MPSQVDAGFAAWLKAPALYASLVNAGLPAGLQSMALDQEVLSPLATRAAAASENTRQMNFLGRPLAMDRHTVKGQRRDLIAKPVMIAGDFLGYANGPELAVNGAFPGDVSGWNADVGTLAWNAGVARVTTVLLNQPASASQWFPTIVGATYQVTGDAINGTAPARIQLGQTNFGGEYGAFQSTVGGKLVFVAATATTYIQLRAYSFSSPSGVYADFDNISAKSVGVSAFVIEAEEQADDTTILTVLRTL